MVSVLGFVCVHSFLSSHFEETWKYVVSLILLGVFVGSTFTSIRIVVRSNI